MRSSRVIALVGLAGVLSIQGGAAAHAGETRGYVVRWFVNASHSQDGDCPDGLNWSVEENLRLILKQQGKSDAEIARASAQQLAANGTLQMRGRIDGKPVNVYLNPTAVPDPGAHAMMGKISPGFDLDGKTTAEDFTDPETGEQGIDNQLFRALGCFVPYRSAPPDLGRISFWDMVRDAMPAWLIEIGDIDDPRNDEDVSVGLYQALEPITRTLADGGPERDLTYRVDPIPLHQNRTRGRIKDGVLTTAPFSVNMMFDPENIPEFHFRDARLRLRLEPGGELRGILGGYHDWRQIYWGIASPGVFAESVTSQNMPGMYYLMRKLADGYPDATTGENTAISATFRIEAVPAFVVRE
jgi:hypothetical protein